MLVITYLPIDCDVDEKGKFRYLRRRRAVVKIDFGPSEPRELDHDAIDVVSTSSKTASASPVILSNTEIVQTKFEPTLVENDKSPEKSVSGKLIYEKKRKKDTEFPSEKLSRQSVKVGEVMEISLGTTETYNLFTGLQQLYALYDDMGGVPFGSATYARIDSSFKNFLNIIQNDPSAARMIGRKENFELVKIVLQLITQTDSLESLKNSLETLETPNMVRLNNALNIERLTRVLMLLESNLKNADEEFWQSTFAENQWILSQLFSFPCTIFEEKAYVGGKSLSNTGGNLCDFIYQNKLTQNVAIIEIKTPCTEIIGSPYRGTFCFSHDMSGAINQVINYRDKLTKDYYANCYNSSNSYEVFAPKCLVLIGKVDGLEKGEIAALENYRGSLTNVNIVTYDELVLRIMDMINIFSNSDNDDQEIQTAADFDSEDDSDELPF